MTLVLTRHVGQSIIIGDDVKITLTKIEGAESVKVGIDAPKDIKILRAELEKIEDE